MNRGGKGKKVEKILNMIIKEAPNDKSVMEDVQEIVEVYNKNKININLKSVYKE